MISYCYRKLLENYWRCWEWLQVDCLYPVITAINCSWICKIDYRSVKHAYNLLKIFVYTTLSSNILFNYVRFNAWQNKNLGSSQPSSISTKPSMTVQFLSFFNDQNVFAIDLSCKRPTHFLMCHSVKDGIMNRNWKNAQNNFWNRILTTIMFYFKAETKIGFIVWEVVKTFCLTYKIDSKKNPYQINIIT